MFAYCNNNPVCASDSAGYAAGWTNTVVFCDGKMLSEVIGTTDNYDCENGPSSNDLLEHLTSDGILPDHDGILFVGVEYAGIYENHGMSDLANGLLLALEIVIFCASIKLKVATTGIMKFLQLSAKGAGSTLSAVGAVDTVSSLINPLEGEDYHCFKVAMAWYTIDPISSAGDYIITTYNSTGYYVWNNDSDRNAHFLQISYDCVETSRIQSH